MNYNNCYKCDEPLSKRGAYDRTTPKMCPTCRGARVGGNSKIRQIFLELKNNSRPEDETERFEDVCTTLSDIDKDFGRIIRKPTEISRGCANSIYNENNGE